MGWNTASNVVTPSKILASADANIAIQKSSISNTYSSLVQFFAKDIDEDGPFKKSVVKSYLEEIGFRVKITKPRISNISSNALFYSHNVPSEDIKAAALTLIRAGVSIKSIHPATKNYAQNKLIQIGADGDYLESTPLTVNQISKANFPIGKKTSLP